MIGIKINSRIGAVSRYGQILRKELEAAVDQGGAYLRDTARSIAPVRTGAYRASIHYVSARRSGFEAAAGAAVRRAAFGGSSNLTIGTASGGRKRVGSNAQGTMLFGGTIQKPTNPYEVYCFAAVGYGIFVEYGTRNMAGQFVLTRAATMARPMMRQLVMDAIKRTGTQTSRFAGTVRTA